jgi:hypothetical protein
MRRVQSPQPHPACDEGFLVAEWERGWGRDACEAFFLHGEPNIGVGSVVGAVRVRTSCHCAWI